MPLSIKSAPLILALLQFQRPQEPTVARSALMKRIVQDGVDGGAFGLCRFELKMVPTGLFVSRRFSDATTADASVPQLSSGHHHRCGVEVQIDLTRGASDWRKRVLARTSSEAKKAQIFVTRQSVGTTHLDPPLRAKVLLHARALQVLLGKQPPVNAFEALGDAACDDQRGESSCQSDLSRVKRDIWDSQWDKWKPSEEAYVGDLSHE